MVSTASLLGARHLWEVVENNPASSLVVSLGKALVEDRWSRHLKKWQLPSECGRPVQNIAIQFAMEDKYEQIQTNTKIRLYLVRAKDYFVMVGQKLVVK